METQAKQATWVVPTLVVTFTALTLIALVSWVQIIFGGFMPGSVPFSDAGGMMGGVGMMINAADGPGAGGMMGAGTHDMGAMMGNGDMAKNHDKLHNDPKMKETHEKCEKTMGTDHDKMHQQMHGNSNTTKKTL